MKTNQTFVCPNCGGEVRKGSAACPHCGSDDQTGWSDGTYLDGIDINNDVDYDEILEQEFPSSRTKKKTVSWVIIVAAVLLVLSVLGFIKILM
jgi:uncharacterized membrane protein YvbJ